MLRRAQMFLCSGTGGAAAGSNSGNFRFKSAEHWNDDQRGRFDTAQIAETLGIHPREAQGLLWVEDRNTFRGRGRAYPSSLGRTSRPGSKACRRAAVFPLYQSPGFIRDGLKRSYRKLSNQ